MLVFAPCFPSINMIDTARVALPRPHNVHMPTSVAALNFTPWCDCLEYSLSRSDMLFFRWWDKENECAGSERTAPEIQGAAMPRS